MVGTSAFDAFWSSDVLPETLQDLFSYNPPLRVQPPERQLDRRLVGTQPFNFYDRHINNQQALKRVALLPSLTNDLVRCVDDCLSELKRRDEGPRPATYGADFVHSLELPLPRGEVEPSNICNHYGLTVARTCLAMTSTWIIHPQTVKYHSVLRFNSGGKPPPLQRHAVFEHHTLRFAPFEKVAAEVISSIDDFVKRALKDLANRNLAIWLFLPCAPHTEEMLQNMDQMIQLSAIPSAVCCTRGCPPVSNERPQTPDAKSTSWTLPILKGVAPGRPRERPSPQIPDGCISSGPSLSQRSTEFINAEDSTPEGLAHHAWQLAVRDDTTVIVFNCGNFERIGIRHRATQTLYLSETIDVTQCRPSYGKLHLGLQMSIVKDVLDRHQQLVAMRPSSASGKRSRQENDNISIRKSRRQKLNALKAKVISKTSLNQRDTKIFWEELGKRHVALIQLCEGHLQSPVPALFVRKGGSLSHTLWGCCGEDCDV